MIQFVGKFPRQMESAEKTVQRSFFNDMVLDVGDLQHQFSHWFLQPFTQLVVTDLDFLPLSELPVASFHSLFGFHHRQRGVKSVIQSLQRIVHVSRLLAARHHITSHRK